MSHYTKMTIAAQQAYEAELVQALKKHFGEKGVEVGGDTKIELKSWDGRNAKLKANIVVRKDTQGKKLGRYVATNDLGYERNKDGGYTLHADEAGFPKEHQNLVAQSYAELVATKKMKQQGFAVKRTETKAGEIRLSCTKYM